MDDSSAKTHRIWAAAKALTNVLTQALTPGLPERDITVNAVSRAAPAVHIQPDRRLHRVPAQRHHGRFTARVPRVSDHH